MNIRYMVPLCPEYMLGFRDTKTRQKSDRFPDLKKLTNMDSSSTYFLANYNARHMQ